MVVALSLRSGKRFFGILLLFLQGMCKAFDVAHSALSTVLPPPLAFVQEN